MRSPVTRVALRLLEAQVQDKANALSNAETRIKELELEVRTERARRVAAQRGLVAYMKDHGLEDRIGYDPDKDPALTGAVG